MSCSPLFSSSNFIGKADVIIIVYVYVNTGFNSLTFQTHHMPCGPVLPLACPLRGKERNNYSPAIPSVKPETDDIKTKFTVQS